MSWKEITSLHQWKSVLLASANKPQVVFKHSTRCSISNLAKARLEKQPFPHSADFYYIDLLSHRDVSNAIADTLMVEHESPQVLLVKNGACVYEESHNGITMDELLEQLNVQS